MIEFRNELKSFLPKWLEWHQESHILFAGAVEGETWMWKIPSGDCKTVAGFGIQNECGKILPDGKLIQSVRF